jgi:hypothetical protein
MHIQKRYRIWVALLLIPMFFISVAIALLPVYSTVTINTVLAVGAAIVALLSLYGSYKLISTFIKSNNPSENVAVR